jgi:hypothetical protein
VFGRRADLVAMAKERIARRPDRYVNHLYGEHEVGGTSWMYLTGRPVQEIGLLSLPVTPPPERTEAIQHGIFKYGIIPVAFYGLLAGVMWYTHRTHPDDHPGIGEASERTTSSNPDGGAR